MLRLVEAKDKSCRAQKKKKKKRKKNKKMEFDFFLIFFTLVSFQTNNKNYLKPRLTDEFCDEFCIVGTTVVPFSFDQLHHKKANKALQNSLLQDIALVRPIDAALLYLHRPTLMHACDKRRRHMMNTQVAAHSLHQLRRQT